MSKHSEHAHHHEGHKNSAEDSLVKGLHRRWLVWLAVGLMLAAMALYVVTMSESLEPEVDAGPEIPAAAE